GEGRWRAALRAAVHARAEPHGHRGVTLGSTAEPLTYDELAGLTEPRLVTDVPGPNACRLVQADRGVTSPSLPRAYELVPARGGPVFPGELGNRGGGVGAGAGAASHRAPVRPGARGFVPRPLVRERVADRFAGQVPGPLRPDAAGGGALPVRRTRTAVHPAGA